MWFQTQEKQVGVHQIRLGPLGLNNNNNNEKTPLPASLTLLQWH